MPAPSVPIRRAVLVFFSLIFLVAAAATGCERESDSPEGDDALPGEAIAPEARDEPPITDPPGQVPDWIQSVSPEPSSQTSGTLVVSVDPAVTVPNRAVRLEIDGVDVTAQANPQPPSETEEQVITANRLTYDPDSLREQGLEPLVPLIAGRHTATARLIEFPGTPEANGTEIDSFTWTFEVF